MRSAHENPAVTPKGDDTGFWFLVQMLQKGQMSTLAMGFLILSTLPKAHHKKRVHQMTLQEGFLNLRLCLLPTTLLVAPLSLSSCSVALVVET